MNYTPALWKLLLICSIASFCALLPADVIPALALQFQITSDHAESILSWFLLGYGVGPLVYGPIANCIGRKKTLLTGFTVAFTGMMASVVSLTTDWYALMLIGRLLAGIGTSAGLIIGMLMLNETNEPTEARRKYSIIILFFAFAPALAMAIGGQLLSHLGASSVIITMPIILVLLIVMSLTFKETYKDSPVPIQVRQLAHDYTHAFCSTPFIFLAFIMATASAAMYLFNGLSPLIAINALGIAPKVYGELAIISSAGLFFGALFSARLANALTANQHIFIALLVSLMGSLIMLVAFTLNTINLYTLLVPAFLIFCGAAIIVPNTSMTALHRSSNPAIAASVINGTALIMSSVILSVGGYAFRWGFLTLPLSLCLMAILGLIFFVLASREPYHQADCGE